MKRDGGICEKIEEGGKDQNRKRVKVRKKGSRREKCAAGVYWLCLNWKTRVSYYIYPIRKMPDLECESGQ